LGFLFFKVLETEEEEEEERTSGVGFKHQWFLLLFLGKPKRRTAMFFITPDEMFVFPLIKSFNFFYLKLIFYIVLVFDVKNKFKKYYFNIFINKNYFKNHNTKLT
jgi:hypothetical protein